MNQREIRVGIVGANAKSSRAKVSHVPAINLLHGLKLSAGATHNEQSAREAPQAFGADRWFSDPFAMIRDERIDVITTSSTSTFSTASGLFLKIQCLTILDVWRGACTNASAGQRQC